MGGPDITGGPAACKPQVQHHLLLCATPGKPLCCSDPQRGIACWERLKVLVRELGLEDPARPQGVVWRSKIDCLRICRQGPVLHIWPEGITYGELTPERLERILKQHVLAGQPVWEWVLAQSPFSAG